MSLRGSLSATSSLLKHYWDNTMKRYNRSASTNKMKRRLKLNLLNTMKTSHFKMIMANSFSFKKKKIIETSNIRRKKRLFQRKSKDLTLKNSHWALMISKKSHKNPNQENWRDNSKELFDRHSTNKKMEYHFQQNNRI